MYKPKKQVFGRLKKNWTQLCRTVKVWFTVSFQKLSLMIEKLITLRRGQKIKKILAVYWKIIWKTWMTLSAITIKILLVLKQMKECEYAGDTHSNTRLLFTVQRARQKSCLAVQGSIWNCKLCIGKFFVSIYVKNDFLIRSFFLRFVIK